MQKFGNFDHTVKDNIYLSMDSHKTTLCHGRRLDSYLDRRT